MADQYDDLGHAELDELLEPLGLSKSGNLEEKRDRLRRLAPSGGVESHEEAAAEPVQHPGGTGHVLQDGQWVLPEVQETEAEKVEAEGSEE